MNKTPVSVCSSLVCAVSGRGGGLCPPAGCGRALGCGWRWAAGRSSHGSVPSLPAGALCHWKKKKYIGCIPIQKMGSLPFVLADPAVRITQDWMWAMWFLTVLTFTKWHFLFSGTLFWRHYTCTCMHWHVMRRSVYRNILSDTRRDETSVCLHKSHCLL